MILQRIEDLCSTVFWATMKFLGRIVGRKLMRTAVMFATNSVIAYSLGIAKSKTTLKQVSNITKIVT